MQTCPKCGNHRFNKEGLCSYCVWKGDAGPGAEFKAIIKEISKSTPPTFRNHPDRLKKWAWFATEELDNQADQERLRRDAMRLIREGKLRGDISEYWIRNYNHLRGQLQDLYL